LHLRHDDSRDNGSNTVAILKPRSVRPVGCASPPSSWFSAASMNAVTFAPVSSTTPGCPAGPNEAGDVPGVAIGGSTRFGSAGLRSTGPASVFLAAMGARMAMPRSPLRTWRPSEFHRLIPATQVASGRCIQIAMVLLNE
jgi:hypothetical protein